MPCTFKGLMHGQPIRIPPLASTGQQPAELKPITLQHQSATCVCIARDQEACLVLLTLQVEDIIDTGNTLSRLAALLHEAGAASVRIAALLDKKARRKVTIDAEYVGFQVSPI